MDDLLLSQLTETYSIIQDIERLWKSGPLTPCT